MPIGHHPATVEQHDAVGEGDGRRAVGDDDRGSAPHHLGEGVADLVLLGRVDGRGGVVEDQDAWIGEDGAGDGDPLALPARQRVAPLADDRGVAVGSSTTKSWAPASRAATRSLGVASGRRRRCWRRPCRRTGTSPRTRCRRPSQVGTASRRTSMPSRRRSRRRRRRSGGAGGPRSTSPSRWRRRGRPTRRAPRSRSKRSSTGRTAGVAEGDAARSAPRPRACRWWAGAGSGGVGRVDDRGLGGEDLVDPFGRCPRRWAWARIMPSIRSGQISITTYTLKAISVPMVMVPSSTRWPP